MASTSMAFENAHQFFEIITVYSYRDVFEGFLAVIHTDWLCVQKLQVICRIAWELQIREIPPKNRK